MPTVFMNNPEQETHDDDDFLRLEDQYTQLDAEFAQNQKEVNMPSIFASPDEERMYYEDSALNAQEELDKLIKENKSLKRSLGEVTLYATRQLKKIKELQARIEELEEAGSELSPLVVVFDRFVDWEVCKACQEYSAGSRPIQHKDACPTLKFKENE